MKSRTTAQFWKLFADLPPHIQQQALATYLQFQKDASYPSLRFKKVHPNLAIYSVRITKDYRAVGELAGDRVIRFWVGTHADYNRLLG
ncbi:hypothetical protein [Synechococcus sp. PCC 6312]|uniref:ParE family toxin-like protein n=1 Tax=Synechococcus sp. (strain ATCC 27167 / PCC 6312) TaxID=195253 RepID=UPI00029F36FB|nr:hypothetical protein [Synechococcus sp. PCC 6312]AFY60454.1 hypothetical protein Syn6312_1273 [Synechococcus sp. PCC 6312]